MVNGLERRNQVNLRVVDWNRVDRCFCGIYGGEIYIREFSLVCVRCLPLIRILS